MNHFKVICSECKDVIEQCRCFSLDKTIRYDICDKCIKAYLKDVTEGQEDVKKFNGALPFDGKDDYIDFSNPDVTIIDPIEKEETKDEIKRSFKEDLLEVLNRHGYCDKGVKNMTIDFEAYTVPKALDVHINYKHEGEK